jgi:hypothetical protein
MSLWRIALFANTSDAKPYRVGYLFADTHSAALEIVSETKANCARMDATPATMRPARMPSEMKQVFWDD